MPKAVVIKKDQPKIESMIETKAPSSDSIRRARKVMKLYHSGGPKLHNTELAKLLDEFGIDFMCQHACRAEVYGRGACCEGHCERPMEYTGAEDCTCRQAMFYNIDSFVGYRSDEEAADASASMYAQVPNEQRNRRRVT
jgi:hypothetical protein